MKKFVLSLLALCLFLPSPGMARPQESLHKLSKSQNLADSGQLPPIVLNKKEEDELISYIIKEYKKQGVKVTRQQAAITAGHMANAFTGLPQFAEALAASGKVQSKPRKPVPQDNEIMYEDPGKDAGLAYDVQYFDPKSLLTAFIPNFMTAGTPSEQPYIKWLTY